MTDRVCSVAHDASEASSAEASHGMLTIMARTTSSRESVTTFSTSHTSRALSTTTCGTSTLGTPADLIPPRESLTNFSDAIFDCSFGVSSAELLLA